MPPTPRRHHLVPEFYLNRFANERGQVQVFDRFERKSFVTSTKNVAVEVGFYDSINPDGSTNPIAEETLSLIESGCATIIKRICRPSLADSRPSDDEWHDLALYVAVQFSRTADYRRTILADADLMFRMEVDLNFHALGRERFKEWITKKLVHVPTDEEMRGFLELGSQIANLKITPPRNYFMEAIFRHAVDFAPLFFVRPWTLIRSKKKSFITSDRPVSLWRMLTKENRHYGLGIDTAEKIFFPLDPWNVIELRPPAEQVWRHGFVSGPETDRINQAIAHWSERRIIHHPGHRPLGRLTIARRGPITHINGVPVRDDINVWKQIRQGFIDKNIVPVIHTAHGMDQDDEPGTLE